MWPNGWNAQPELKTGFEREETHCGAVGESDCASVGWVTKTSQNNVIIIANWRAYNVADGFRGMQDVA